MRGACTRVAETLGGLSIHGLLFHAFCFREKVEYARQYWWEDKHGGKAELVAQNSLSAELLPTSDVKHLNLPEQVYFRQPLVMDTWTYI